MTIKTFKPATLHHYKCMCGFDIYTEDKLRIVGAAHIIDGNVIGGSVAMKCPNCHNRYMRYVEEIHVKDAGGTSWGSTPELKDEGEIGNFLRAICGDD